MAKTKVSDTVSVGSVTGAPVMETAFGRPTVEVKIGLAKYLGMSRILEGAAIVLKGRYRMETHTKSEWDALVEHETTRRVLP